MTDPAGVEEYPFLPYLFKCEFNLEIIDNLVPAENSLRKISECRNIPLPIVKLVKEAAFHLPGKSPEIFIKKRFAETICNSESNTTKGSFTVSTIASA